MRAEKFSEGWFEYKSNKVAQLQQILFIIFTIVGFILCILSIALRADMWFKDEWSSFILGTFVPYIVSTCLAAVIYLHESGHGGLRYKNRTSKYNIEIEHYKEIINCPLTPTLNIILDVLHVDYPVDAMILIQV